MQRARFSPSKRHIQIGIAAGVLGFLFLGTWQVLSGAHKHQVPEEFASARVQGAIVAQDIVDIIAHANERLRQVSFYDQNGEYQEALNVSLLALEEGRRVPERAVDLSKQLQTMTTNLVSIHPPEAREKAQAAILTEVQLINHLITYSNLHRQLLEELRLKLRAHQNGVANPGVEIRARIDEINQEVRSINVLNQEFLSLMAEFDGYFSKE